MKQARALALCSMGVLVAAGLWAQAPRELRLGTATGSLGGTVSVPLTMNSNAQVQGFVAAADWDGALLKGTAVDSGAVLSSADVNIRRIQANYFVVGVVMDSDGEGGEIIAPGNGIALATV